MTAKCLVLTLLTVWNLSKNAVAYLRQWFFFVDKELAPFLY